MDDQKNLILAILLSLVVMLGYQKFFVEPAEDAQRQAAVERGAETLPAAPNPIGAAPPVAPGSDTPPAVDAPPAADTPPAAADPVPAEVVKPAQPLARDEPRLQILTDRLQGSISLRGGRIDDLVLLDYYDRLGEGRENIVLLKNKSRIDGYFAEFGWQKGAGATVDVPTPETLWKTAALSLRHTSPAVLTWDNGAGLLFTRTISIDDDFLFTITDRVENSSGETVALAPYGLIVRKTTPETAGFVILHEGALGVLGGTLEEVDYDDLEESGTYSYDSTGGWLGFTDKYWLTALMPDPNAKIKARFVHRKDGASSRYQADYIADQLTSIAAGDSFQVTTRLFAGAKEVEIIDRYEEAYGIELFDRTIDWGWFYLLTKPIFAMLVFFHKLVGNFGVAILLLTLVIKLIFFPLANKQYTAMS
ncbi:MAG: membrane protein insertase YidC, partial [Sphingomonadales bacterium]